MTGPDHNSGRASAPPPRCVLICTHQVRPDREAAFLRFLDSALSQILSPGMTLAVFALLQGCHEVPPAISARIGADPRVTITCTPGLLPASAARNRALAAADISDGDIVLFPDDDCWYPAGLLDHLAGTMRARGGELLFVWYREPPLTGDERRDVTYARPTPTEVMRRTGMITMVLAGRVVREIGTLDERIGLGTDLSGGEDTDYAYRAYKVARGPLMTRAALIGHRALADDLTTRIAVMPRYWPGLMLQTLKHLELRLLPLALYRCGVGIALVLLRRLSLSDFVRPFVRLLGGGRMAHRPAEGVQS